MTVRKVALTTDGHHGIERGIALTMAEVGFNPVIDGLIRDADATLGKLACRVGLYLMFNSGKMRLAKQGIKVGRVLVGNYVTSCVKRSEQCPLWKMI